MIITLDYETRSRADLPSVGAHRYACDASTEVLMCGVNELLWQNPKFSDDTSENAEAERLIAEAELIYAHNAPFEQAITWGTSIFDIPIHKWRCTAALARKAGLPAKLEKLAEALGLAEQKDKKGKNLIKLFSMPQKDGSFVDPRSRPVEWKQFCEYCRQDIKTEIAVHQRLQAFDLTGLPLETFLFDLRMNQLGVPVNVQALRNAQAIIDTVTERVTKEFVSLTGLNPTQRERVRLLVGLPDMQGETVEAALARPDCQNRRVLELYHLLSYAAVKKVQSMLDWACPDGRLRGCFKYYGAGTGRWCLTGDHEVLTPEGWVRLDQWQGGRIAVWNKSGEISFQKSNAMEFDYTGDLYHHWSHRIDQIATPDHKMGGWHERTGDFEVRTVGNLRTNFQIPYTGIRKKPADMHNDELRMLVAVQADGSYLDDGSIRFHFKRQRKIDRILQLLRRLEYPFARADNADKTVSIVIPSRFVPLYLQMFRHKTFGPWLMDVDASVFFEELELWDGSRCGPQSIQYSTINETNADWIQALAHTSGLTAIKIVKKHKSRSPNWSKYHIVNIWLNPLGRHKIACKANKIPHAGKVYCAETSTGFFLVRRNGTAWITGNSSGGPQIHNAKKPSKEMSKLVDTAYAAISNGITADGLAAIYGDPYEVVANCIRQFVHLPGSEMLDGDYNAIEGRIGCWVAGQMDILEDWRQGKDLYRRATAFVEGITESEVDSEGRAFGKVVELAAQYALGVQGFMRTCANWGIACDEEKAERAIHEYYRPTHREIVNRWWQHGRDMLGAITRPNEPHGVFTVKRIAGIQYLLQKLPSGRSLAYPHIEVNQREPTAEERKEMLAGRTYHQDRFKEITYWGQLPMSQAWGRVRLYGSLAFQHEVQAIAADVMAHGAINAERRGMPPFALIHDQGLAVRVGGKTAEEFAAALADLPAWARGLPLKVEAKVAPYYKK